MEPEMNELINAWKLCYSGTKSQMQQQAFNYIENFKQNSPNLIEIAYRFAIQNEIPELIHFGLQLISHCIKFNWNSMSIEKKVEIKNALNSVLTQNDSLNETCFIYKLSYLKASLCLTYLELVKREWPQNWPTLLGDLYAISAKSLLHLNLILNLYKYMADEFIANNINLPPARRKDINVYMNAHMKEIFGFFMDTLKTCFDTYKTSVNLDSNQTSLIVNLLETCIDCLSYYVDWIGIGYVIDKDYLLINVLLNLLSDSKLGLMSAKCLIVFASRKGVLTERQSVLYLLNENPLNQLFNCVKSALLDKNDDNREYLKYLITILVEIGGQLNAVCQSNEYILPKDVNLYLNAIYELLHSNQSKLLTYEIVQLWNQLLSNDHLRTKSIIQQYMCELFPQNLVQNANGLMCKLTKKNLSQSDKNEMDNDDDEIHKFAIKFRNEITKLIRTTAKINSTYYVHYGFEWSLHIFQQTQGVCQYNEGFNSNSYHYTTWDGILFLWSNLMQILSKKIKSAEVNENLIAEQQILFKLFKHTIDYKSDNPNYASFNLSLLSSLLPIVDLNTDNQEYMLKIVIDKLLNEFDLFKVINLENGFSDSIVQLYSKAYLKKTVLNVRRQLLAILLNVCRTYTMNIKNLFNYIYEKLTGLLKLDLTQMEQIIVIEILIYLSNEFNSYDLQANFIAEHMLSIKEFLCSNEEFLGSLETTDAFIKFIGLNIDPSGDRIANEKATTNRKQIFYSLNALYGVLKCIQVKELKNENRDLLSQWGFVQYNSLTKQYFTANPAFNLYKMLFEPLIKLLKSFNLLHNPASVMQFNQAYADCLTMTETAKHVALGMQQVQQQQQKDDQQAANKNIELSDTQYDTDRMQMFIFNSYDTLNQLISLYFSKFKYELFFVELTNSDLVYMFGDSLFSSFNTLPDYRLRLQIRYVLKSLIESYTETVFHNNKCSLVLKLIEVLLEYFLPTILQNLNEKNKIYLKLNEEGNDDATNKKIEEQVINENQFTLLCRDLCDIIKCFYQSNTGMVTHAVPLVDDNVDLDNEENDENMKTSGKNSLTNASCSPSALNDLAICLFTNNSAIYQSFLLILFEGLCWSDSWCCLRLARFAQMLFDYYPIVNQPSPTTDPKIKFQTYVNDQVSSHLYLSCLNSLQIHGEHTEISQLLINLSLLLHDKVPLVNTNLFNEILSKIPNMNEKIFADFTQKSHLLNQLQQQQLQQQSNQISLEKYKKDKKDLYKKILQPIIGKNLGQMYKNEIIIRNLPPLLVKNKRNRNFAKSLAQAYGNDYSEENQENNDLNICSLFDPNV